jgi:hypothetical protein
MSGCGRGGGRRRPVAAGRHGTGGC